MAGQCITKSVIYQADVTTNDDETNKQTTKSYIGITANRFKANDTGTTRNHCEILRTQKIQNTELSKHVWRLKENNRQFSIKWPYCNRSKLTNLGQTDADYA